MADWFADIRSLSEAYGCPTPDVPCAPGDDQVELRLSLIEEEVDELVDALTRVQNTLVGCGGVDDELLAEVAKEAADVVVVVLGGCVEFGLPMDKVWDAVHASNMAKVVGGVRRNRLGKVLKPEGWTEPDIAALLEQTSRDQREASR